MLMRLSTLRRCRTIVFGALLLMLLNAGGAAIAQTGSVTVDMSPLDGLAITPDNMLGFTIQSSLPAATNAEIKALIRYRQTGKWLRYSLQTRLQPGLNRIDGGSVRPIYTQSDAALKELFVTYKVLPQGTYQYCIEIDPLSAAGERVAGSGDEQCVINKSEDLFLINLVDPENYAKIHERNPVLSWIVNYPFASQLTYRIRVAEVKQGQNNVTAITRNNPIYAESNLPQTTTTYPVYAKPLELFQPYAWTVDAYFKGLLLGGAEPWRFTIVEDSEMTALPRFSPFVDIRMEQDAAFYYAVGSVKLKYVQQDLPKDSLSLMLMTEEGKILDRPRAVLVAGLGDNRFEVDLKGQVGMKHLKRYRLVVTNALKERFELRFKYVNPDFLQ